MALKDINAFLWRVPDINGFQLKGKDVVEFCRSHADILRAHSGTIAVTERDLVSRAETPDPTSVLFISCEATRDTIDPLVGQLFIANRVRPAVVCEMIGTEGDFEKDFFRRYDLGYTVAMADRNAETAVRAKELLTKKGIQHVGFAAVLTDEMERDGWMHATSKKGVSLRTWLREQRNKLIAQRTAQCPLRPY